jgi:hypothetical protein
MTAFSPKACGITLVRRRSSPSSSWSSTLKRDRSRSQRGQKVILSCNLGRRRHPRHQDRRQHRRQSHFVRERAELSQCKSFEKLSPSRDAERDLQPMQE